MKKTVIVAVALLFLALGVNAQTKEGQAEPAAPAQSAKETVNLVLCAGVQDKEPVDEIADSTSASRVYCWVKIEADAVPTTIKHVWYSGGEKVGEVPLDVKGSPYRIWSSKNVWTGQWKVELTSESGAVLASKEFTVTEAAQVPSQAQ